jgi:hypothetical protein
LTESLSGAAIAGKTPSGVVTANQTQDSDCGGFSLWTVQVKNVNLPNGTVLWVTFEGLSIGEITLSNGSGTMPTYNIGPFSVLAGHPDSSVSVYDSVPDQSPFQKILVGGDFSEEGHGHG